MKHEMLLHRGNYPEISWGLKEDGTPKVLMAQFKADVRVSGDGTIYCDEERWAYDVAEIKERVEALQEAVRWVEGGLSLAVEKFYAQEIAEGREGPKQDEPPPPEQRWGIEVGNGYQVWWEPQGDEDNRFAKNWRVAVTLDPNLRVDSTSVIELTNCPRVSVSKGTADALVDFLAVDHDEVEVSGVGPGAGLHLKLRLENNTFVEFDAGAVICRLDRVQDNGLYRYREYFAMTRYGRFAARWRAGDSVARWGGAALQVWHP